MSNLYRAQVLLERQQHESLRKLAASQDRSMSDLIREAVAEYLVEHDEEFGSWKDTLAQMVRLREEIMAETGMFAAESILNDRAEREDELAERLWGDQWPSL